MAVNVVVDVVDAVAVAVVHIELAQRMSGQPAKRQLCGRVGEAAAALVTPECPGEESPGVNVARAVVIWRLLAAISVCRTAIAVSIHRERGPVHLAPSG